MKLINKSKVKVICGEHKKRISLEFYDQLEYRVQAMIIRAIKNSRHFKTLKAGDLI